jgi:hypothetical protein
MLTLQDLEAALPLVRPSAMRSLFVDSPPVRWGEIGGQAGELLFFSSSSCVLSSRVPSFLSSAKFLILVLSSPVEF